MVSCTGTSNSSNISKDGQLWNGRIENKHLGQVHVVILVEMSCLWIDNRVVKVEEKTRKYGPLRLELKKQYPGYKITQHNIIMDVLGWYSEEVRESVQSLVGERSKIILRKMQKAMLSNTLKIARGMKILDHDQ